MKAPEKIFISPLLMQGCRTLSTRVTENDAVYIREDLIKAEIEGRMKEHKDWSSFYHSRGKHSDFEKGAIFALNRVLNFINNLFGEKSTRQRLAEWSQTPEGRESYEKVAEEMRKEKSEKPMNQDEDLEEEIERIVKCEKEFMNFKFKSQLIGYIARHFAKWGAEHAREQMMKEAVEGEISSVDVGDDSYVKTLKISELQKAIRNYNRGDKVRIIIVKEDEK